jgi:hypothetical protein
LGFQGPRPFRDLPGVFGHKTDNFEEEKHVFDRKMGHYTVLSANRDEAIKLAMQVRAELNIGT